MERRTKIGIILILVLLLRLVLVPVHININDDLAVFQEWGRVFQVTGPGYFFFFYSWVYFLPTQPPPTPLLIGYSYALYENHLLLAQWHNQFGLPPGFFVKYFYDNGYYLLLKLPAILADLGIGILIYNVVQKIKPDKALFASAFYVLNPLTIFLSGIWGQTESVIALFG